MRRGVTMARFMPQDLFDNLAVTHLMCLNAPPNEQPMLDEWEEMLRHYVDGSYRGENYDSLKRQLVEASATIKELVDKLENPNQYKHYFDLLTRLSESIRADARKKRPFVKRIVGGSWFNYETKEPAGRIEQCRQNVGRAIGKDLATEVLSFQGTQVEKKHGGWFSNWYNKVDIGLRPRNVFMGAEVNLYPFTQRGLDWLEQNINKFMEPVWSRRDRCLMLSELDCLALMSVVEMLQDAGLKVRFYGRLKGWDGKSPFWLERS